MTLTVREARLLELREQGWSVKRISEETGVSAASVTKIVSMYNADTTSDRRYRQNMERANRQFLARLRAEMATCGREV